MMGLILYIDDFLTATYVLSLHSGIFCILHTLAYFFVHFSDPIHVLVLKHRLHPYYTTHCSIKQGLISFRFQARFH